MRYTIELPDDMPVGHQSEAMSWMSWLIPQAAAGDPNTVGPHVFRSGDRFYRATAKFGFVVTVVKVEALN